MKKLFQIGSKILSGYFLALPILFAIHTFDHDHQKAFDAKSEVRFEESLDCDLCDLIDLQTLSIEQNKELLTLTFISEVSDLHIDQCHTSTFTLQRLRGPPLV